VSQAVRSATVTADLYVEIQQFYARQMRALDAFQLEAYVNTFTEDGIVDHAHKNEKVQGRADMLAGIYAALPRYTGLVVRHWFDQMLIDIVDDTTLHVSYASLVTRTDVDGNVVFEPTFLIEDVLVRQGGELYTRSRVIHRDKAGPLPTP
jgi:hypothetical protein